MYFRAGTGQSFGHVLHGDISRRVADKGPGGRFAGSSRNTGFFMNEPFEKPEIRLLVKECGIGRCFVGEENTDRQQDQRGCPHAPPGRNDTFTCEFLPGNRDDVIRDKEQNGNYNRMPSPPFRTMAPSGAPMKNRMRQANESVNFRCHSMRCLRNDLF